jgi:hypothetical protein
LASSPDPLLQWLSNAGSLGILAAAVLAFLRGWIVPGSVAEQLRGERDRATAILEKQLDVAQRALEVAERERRSHE